MYSKKNRKQNDILHCVKNRKFIRLEKLDRFARRMRYFLLFTISFTSFVLSSVTSRCCVSSLFRFYAPLPLFREINRTPSVATESVNFSKRMAILVAGKGMKTNDLTWSLSPHRKTLWKATIPIGKTRFILCKTRYATRLMFSATNPASRSAIPSSSLNSLFGFSRNEEKRPYVAQLGPAT